jgi:acyl-coenzyme A synthetase/AMP-(fatty) acid ligase
MAGPDANIWTRFVNTAGTFPDKTALIHDERTWSFAALQAHALACAEELREAKVAANDRVVISARNSCELAATLLGVWALGAIPVFVHAESPMTHLAHAAKLTGAALCILDKGVNEAKEVVACPVIALEPRLDSTPAKGRQSRRYNGPAVPTSPASIVFTSGSTGLPKGVVQSHANLLIGCDTVHAYLGYQADDRIVCPVQWSFDYGYGHLLTTLCHGLTHILPKTNEPFALCAAIDAHKPTVLPGTPSWFGYLFRGVSPVRTTDLSSIRIVTNTGGTIPSGILDDMLVAFSHAKIFLNYGLTETYRSSYLDPALVQTHRNSVGQPMPGVDIQIIRDDGTPALPGELGEIVHRGNCICLGYWGDPEATAKALRPDPLLPAEATAAAKTLYTGDFGYKDEDGFLYYRGRRDHQIKSMGVRVSPGEIEAILHDSRLVGNIAVFGLPHDIIGDAVMAAFEPLSGDSETVMRLKSYARQTMSPHMQPREYFPFERLPATPTGKIDYVTLRKICREQSTFLR